MKGTNIALAMPQMKAFLSSFGQSVFSLAFNFGGLLAGALAVYFSVFSLAPWSIALFPGILSIRGAIGGLFSGHLSTELHMGTIKASYTNNTKSFYILLRSVIVLALISGVMIGASTSLFGLFLWNATFSDFVEILSVVVATMGLSVLFIPPLTLGVSVIAFRRGLDPDVVVYPIISTLSDIIDTLCYVFCLNIFFNVSSVGNYLVWLIDLVFVFVAVYLFIKTIKETEFAKMIKQFLLTLVSVTVIVNITGSLLVRVSQVIDNRPEVYMVYPALIDTVGDVGSIIGSTVTTKLALGSIAPKFSSIKKQLRDISGAWSASLVLFVCYTLVSSFSNGLSDIGGILRFAGQLMITNIIAVAVMIVISYSIAIFTYRRGLNPDTFVIPIESSLADTITTAAVLVGLALIL
ncbi:MAG: magnesium transporter [Candidatus Bathyarchaeia archaeon]